MNMTMLTRAAVAAALLCAAACVNSVAQACEVGDQKVESVKTDRPATYDENGDFVGEVKKADIVIGTPLVACRDTPQLIKVKLANNDTVWVDRLAVKVAGGPAKKPAKCSKVVAREPDAKTPAVSGIDPCSG
jgi:alanine dehydrogenase